ncbi:DUF4347 domain-containing protein [Okeania sp.]|uniref:DUF4347 domain-containing protein n=1 Tax=Okeania sp. TaxID=3100323 RepID=UPI002B4AC823|nr:DUF4347 domain-containing protein [Okeania sp.]MEB3342272.1 DUF4347 domain-containing protein [Okeania sp.]
MDNQPKSLVFLDTSISNYQQLMEGIDRNNTEIILINGSQNGIEVITNVLAQRQNLKNIQILSHGSEGALYLGNSKLDSSNLQDYSAQLDTWGKAMTNGGDFLLYGCNVASGDGKTFVEELSRITRRDVAASEDLTGSSVRGGDWDLEFKTGDIEARSALLPEVRANFAGVLDPVTIYKDSNYQGWSKSFYSEGFYTNFGDVGNDSTSSIKVEEGYKATLYKDNTQRSDSIIFLGNNSKLENNFNDIASAIKIEKIPETGLKATLYSNEDFTGDSVKFNTNIISQDWGGFNHGVPREDPDFFSAVWEGYFVPPESGTYKFSYKADDVVRFQIDTNGNEWFDIDSGWYTLGDGKSSSEYFQEGTAYKTKVSYFERKGDASIDFTVDGPGRSDSRNLSGLFVPYNPPKLSITPLNSESSERSGYAQFQVTADKTAPYDIDLNFSWNGQYTTKDGQSYFGRQIPRGSRETIVKIPIKNDSVYESSETLTFTLKPGNPAYLLGSNTTATAEIIDNDMKVSLEGGGETLKEAEQGKTNLTLKISDGGFQETTPVTFNTTGSLHLRIDPITVPAGQTSVDVPVTAIKNTDVINDESFQISVAPNLSYYQLADNNTVNINVEDDEPEIDITSTGIIEEAGATGEFTINFTKVNPQEFELKFQVEGTAKHGTLRNPSADSDYKLFYDALNENGKSLELEGSNYLKPGTDKAKPDIHTVKVPANTKTIKLRVQPINDELWEPDETVTITLLDHAESTSANKQYYKINSSKNTGTFTIKDNEPTISLGKVVNPEEGFGFGSTIQELGKALALDGEGYVRVPSSDKLDLSSNGKFTQEAWVDVTGSGEQAIFGDGTYQTNNQKAFPRLWITKKQGVKAAFGDGEVYHELFSPDNVLNPNSWNHLAATFDGTDYKIYVNGVEIVSTDKYKGKKPDNSQQFDIGRNGESDYFQGAIDEVRLWNVARTPGEIQNAMVTPLTGEETGLIGYWSFENNTNDSSSNDNHGTYVDNIFITPNNGNNESQFIDSQANPDGKNLGKTLYFTGEGKRQVTTRAFDTTVVDNITFDLIFSDGTNGGEAADEGKDVVLEYSTDGGNKWQQLAIYDTENYTQWTAIQETLPENARADKTEFRWRQIRDDGSGDNWGLANVQVANYINNPAPQIGYIEVNLDRPFEAPQGLWVNYDINSTAKQNEDYFNSRYRKVSTDGNSERDGIIIPQGETSGRIYIVANPDALEETDEELTITLKPHNFDNEAGSSNTNTNYRVDSNNETRLVKIIDNGAYQEKALFLDKFDRPIDTNNPLYVDGNGQATIKVKLAGLFSDDNEKVAVTVSGKQVNFDNSNWDRAQTITIDDLTTSSTLSYSYSNKDGNQSGSIPVTATPPQLIQTEEGSTADLIPVTPEVSINKGRDVREGDNQPGEFIVNLNAPAPEGGLEVKYTVEGTATTKEDYEELPDTIIVEAGETQVILPVAAVDDNILEDKETVEISLVQPLPTVGAEFQVNTYTNSHQLKPVVTALSNGGFVIIWQSYNQDGSDYGIYGQRYDADSNKVGNEFQVNTYTTNWQERPAVTALPNGGFVVTWDSVGQDGSGNGIYGQRYDANGNKAGNEFQVNTRTINAQWKPAVTALTNGDFVVTWNSSDQDGSGTGIYGQRYDADGNKVGNEFLVNTYTKSSQENSAVTALPNGGFVVTWHSRGQDGDGTGVYGQRYDADGNKVGNEFQVNTYTTSWQDHSAVTALTNGGFVVTWNSSDQDGDITGVYGQRYDADGNKVGNEFQVNTYTIGNQHSSEVTALPNGGFVVTWNSGGNQDGSASGVYGQRYNADGNKVGDEFQVNTYTNNAQRNSAITTLANGDFIVAWESQGQDGSNYGIYSQRYQNVFYTVNPEFDSATVEIADNDSTNIELANKVESTGEETSSYTSTFTPVNTSEDGTSETVGVRLPSRPSADVTLKLSNPDTTEGEVTPTNLTFTTNNWDEYQDVTITGKPDSENDGDVEYEIAVTAESDDVNYNDKTTVIPVTNTDENSNIELANKIEVTDPETGEKSTSYTVSFNEVTTSEEGTSETVGVRLPKAPNANVTVELSEVDTTEGEVTPTNLTFTPNNWDEYQDVTITGKPDPENDKDEKDVKYNIYFKDTSDEPKYETTKITVTNTDIDGTGETEAVKKPTASVKVIEQMTETKAGKVEISLSEPVPEGETVTVQFSAYDDNTATEGEDYKLGNKLFINSIADDNNKTQLFDNPFGEESPGNSAKPAFGDVDGDGDTDAVVGTADGTIKYFENLGIGNLQARSGANNPFNNIKVGSNAAPALSDINNDSKLDLVVGAGDGNLSYFVNKSNSTNTLFLSADAIADLTNPFSSIKANNNSVPTFGDLNGDRLPDLVLGAGNGSVTYYFNEGTATKPIFKSNSGNEITKLGNNAMPQLIDWDFDNDLDIIAINSEGEIKYLQNSNSSSPNFTVKNGQILPGITIDPGSALALTDLDEDGDTDAFIGTPNEGIEYLEQFQAVTFKAGEKTKEVTIQPIQDRVDEGEGESFKFTLENGINENNKYEVDSKSNQVELTIGDDDNAGVTVTPKQTDTTTSESEKGKTLTYTVKLDSKPTDVVQVYFGSNDATEALLGTSKSKKLELEVENGKNPNKFPARQGARFFDGNGVRQATTEELNGTNVDKVAFDLIFGNNSNGGEAAEDGEDVILEYSTNGGSSWSVIARYDTEDYAEWTTIEQEIPPEARTPKTQLRWRQVSHDGNGYDNWGLAKVEIPIAQKAEVIQLEFTPDNWDKPQEFFVSGVDDEIDDNNVPYKIITTVQSEDRQYRGLEVEPIQLTNNDDADNAQLEITKITDGVAEGRENIYKVQLSTKPTGEVRVIADPQNDQIRLNDENFGDRMTLTFDETNWDVEQVVRVSAFDDNIVEFIHESQIEFEVESGKYKDFESKAVNDNSEGAIDLGEIQGGYTWKNLGVAGTDRDWFKFTLTDAATTEDFVRLNITEGNKDNLEFKIYKEDDLENAVKTSSSEVKLDGLERGEYYLEIFSPEKSKIEYDLVIADEGYQYETLENDLKPLDVQIVDDDLPTAKIISGPTAAELSSEPGYFTIKLDAPVPNRNGSTGIKVNYEIVGGTATLQENKQLGDYKVTNKNSSKQGSVRIAPGEVQNNVIVVPIDDKLVEDLDLEVTKVTKGDTSNGKTKLNLDVQIPLTVTLTKEENLQEPNDTSDSASILTGSDNLSFENLSISSNDKDWYKFTLLETGTSKHNIKMTPSSSGEGLGDLDIRLYKKENINQVIRYSNFSGRTVENISLDGLPAGDYYIEVYGYSGSTNDYSLSVNAPLKAETPEIFADSTLKFSDDISGKISSGQKFQVTDSRLTATVAVEVNDEDADNILVGAKAKVAGETIQVKLLEGEGYQIKAENPEETEATLVIQDDDTPGVRIVQVGENTTVAEEKTATFAVSLLSEPNAPVTLKLTPGAEIEFVDPVAPTEVEVEKTTYNFATSEPKVDDQTFDIKLNSLVNTDRGDAVAFDIKLKEKPSKNVTVKIYDANDLDPTDKSRPLQEITFTADETAVVNKVTGEKKSGNWNELRKVNLYELDRDASGNYKLVLEVNGQKQEIAINSKVEKVKKETTSITIQPEDWFKLQTVTVAGSQDLVSEPGIFHNTSIQYEVTSSDNNYNEIFVPNQTIEVVDRVLNAKETAQGMKEGLGLLQDSIDELSLPLVGKLKGKNPSIIGDLGNALAKDTESQTQLTSEKLKETIENVLGKLGLEFFNVTTEINELETIVGINLSKQQEYRLPLDANLGIPALGLQTEGDLRAAFNFDMSLTFGIHKQFGFYLDTGTKKDENGDEIKDKDGKPIYNTFLDTGIKVDLKDFKGRGGLGFLALEFTDDPENPTALQVSFTATLNDVDDIKKDTDETKKPTTTIVQKSLITDSGLVIDVPASTSLENDEILAEKIATEEAAIENKIADAEKVDQGLGTVEVTELSKDKLSKEVEKATSKKSENPDKLKKSEGKTVGESELSESEELEETISSEKSQKLKNKLKKSEGKTVGESELSESEELEETISAEKSQKLKNKPKKSEGKTVGESELSESEELEETVSRKKSQNKNKKQQKNNDDSKLVSESGTTSETEEEATQESQTSDRPLIQRRSGTTTSTETLTGNALTNRLSELGINELSVTLPTNVTVELTTADGSYKLSIDNFDLKALVKEVTTIQLPIDLEITGAVLNVTQSTKDGKKVNSYDIQGKFNNADVTYKDLANGGYELGIKEFDLKDFVEKATTVTLPIDLKIDDAKFNITKDTDGKASYDITGKFNNADVSYKDLTDGGYEVKLDNFDLQKFVKDTTKVELPIDAKVDDAVIKITKVTKGEQEVNNYDISGKINNADVSYKDLTDGGYEVKFDDELDLSAVVKAAANDPNLPIPSLSLNKPSLTYSKDDSETKYSFTLADESSISYTKKSNNDYEFIVDHFPIGKLSEWIDTDLGISGASEVFKGNLDVEISPNKKEIVLDGTVDFGKFMKPLINYDVSWKVNKPTLSYTTLGGETKYSFSDTSKSISYAKDAKGQTTFKVDNFPIGDIANVVASGLGLSSSNLPKWIVDATISPTEKSLSVDGEIAVKDFADFVGLNLPDGLNLSLKNPNLSVKGTDKNKSFDFSGTGTLTLPKDSFDDFTEIADLLPGIEATASGLEVSGDIAVSKLSSGDIGLQLGVPVLGAIRLERENDKWKLAAIEDGDRLTIADLGVVATNDEYSFTDLFNYEFKGDANLGLKTKTSIEGNSAFPSFNVDIAADLPLFNYGSQEEADDRGFDIAFNNLEIDLGTFLSDLAKPVVVEVDRIIDPIKPVIKALQADTKLLSKLKLESKFDKDGKPGVSILEIAETLLPENKKIQTAITFAKTVSGIVDTVDALNKQEGNKRIPLGSYNLDDFKAASQDDADDASKKSDSIKLDTDDKSKDTSEDKSKDKSTPEEQAKENEAYKSFSSLEGISIPLIEKPINAAYLLLGKNVDLIKYDIPDLEFGFELSQSFPFWTPPLISGKLGGGITAKTDLAIGFDTYGVNQWWKKYNFDPAKAYLVFDGFYLDDFDKDGKDKPEFSLDGDISAGVNVSILAASAEVKGGVDGNVSFDVEDVGEKTGKNDGKIRGSEILSRINDPLSLFELYGKIDAYLKGEAKVFGLGTVWEKEFARFNLAEFRIDKSGASASAIGGKYSTSYIADATIFLDANLNGLLDDNEPVTVTDSNGNYNLEFDIEYYDTNGNGKLDAEEGQIVAMGGVDTSSGVNITTQMVGSVESAVLTPLTNLQKFLVQEEYVASNKAADKLMTEKLDLPKGGSLADNDPIADIGDDQGLVQKVGVEFYLAHVELQNIIVHANALVQGVNSEIDSIYLEKIVTQGLAEALTSEKVSFDLSNAEDVEFILKEIAAQSTKPDIANGEEEEGTKPDIANGEEISADIIETVAEMVAEANALIDEMATAAEKQSLELVMPTVAPVKRSTQGELTKITKELAAGKSTPETAQEQFTTQLEESNRLEPQLISDTRKVKVYSTGDGEIDENTGKTIDIVIELGEPAPNQGVNILYNISGTATEGEDYQIVGLPNGGSEIYIEPGETQKTITISPENDEISELTEFITLNLRYAAESFVIDSEMQTAVVRIIDDEELTTGDQPEGIWKPGTVDDDTLVGTKKQDTLSGNYGNDSIKGKAGADVLQGSHGNDTIIGGTGSDVVEGNYGDDLLQGNQGNDQIHGGSGVDRISGGADNDDIYGGADDDNISGGAGNDNISGDTGNDNISGDANNDWIQGGVGNDVITGGEGQDVVNGGDGADYFVLKSPEEGLDIVVDFDPTQGDKIIIDSAGFNNPTLEDFQFLNGYLYFQKQQIALIQNEGVSYNYFSYLSEILEIKNTKTLKTPVSPKVTIQETEGAEAEEPSTSSNIVSRKEPANLFAEILQRGVVKVGVVNNPVVYEELEDGTARGTGAELGKTLASALFGDENAVEYVLLDFNQGFEAVANKEVDILDSGATYNLVRDALLDIDFAPVRFYDNDAIIVKADRDIDNAQELQGLTIGVFAGSTTEQNLKDFLAENSIEVEIISFSSKQDIFVSYDNGEIDAVASDRTVLASLIPTFSNPDNHKILDEEISEGPLAPILPENESEWADVVRWVTYVPIQAEEFAITSKNIDQVKADSQDPAIRRFLGLGGNLEGNLGETLGLPADFAENVIKSVGNYDEIYKRVFPGLERKRNHLWTNEGLHYSLPFSGTTISSELINNDERGLLQEILERGVVNVGLPGNSPGFGEQREGEWQGFDVDLGRALAAALFGDPDRVNFVEQDFAKGFPNVANGKVDVSAMAVSHNLVRDAGLGIDYGPTYLYTGQGILVRNNSGITSLPMLNGLRIGVVAERTTKQNLEDNLAKIGGTFVPVEFNSNKDLFAAYESNEIDALATDLTIIATRINDFSNPSEHRILNEVLSKEPLALVIDENQSDWADVVRWVTHTLVQAEEFGITQENVDDVIANSENLQIRRFLGLEENIGETLGLPKDYAVQIIKAVGNYGEAYDRHFNKFNSNILPRGTNELLSDFGLQYAYPLGVPPVTEDEPTVPIQEDSSPQQQDDEIDAADTTTPDETEDTETSDETQDTEDTTSDETEDTESTISDETEDTENTSTLEDETGEQTTLDPNDGQESIEEEVEAGQVTIGTDGSNTLSGGSDNNVLYGMRDDDVLYGNAGEDTTYGGKGNDLIIGGDGDDLLYGNNDNDTIEGEGGNDEVHGNRGLDFINGGDGDDLLYGGKDSDRILGGADNDTIFGDQGNDLLEGNEGDDLIDGGEGDNTLSGGQGGDRFVLAPGNSNLILDFEDGIDFLQLEDGIAFEDLTLTEESGNTVVELNSERLAIVSGVASGLLTAEDFLIAES